MIRLRLTPTIAIRVMWHKAIGYLTSTGITDTAYIGAEAEFFVLDDARFRMQSAGIVLQYRQQRSPLEPRTPRSPNLGHKLRQDEGYLPCPPKDQLFDLRNDVCKH
ncbi:MAG: hypothetical protein R3C05_22425 [Pirellulaceae bacterium]